MPLQEVVSQWDQQPQELAELDLSNPVAQRVRSVLIGGQVFDVAQGRLHTVAGTKTRPTEQGLATAFNATLGGSSADSVTTTLTAHATQRTYFARLRVRSAADSGALGRLFEKRTGSDAQVELLFPSQGSTNCYNFGRTFSGGAGAWTSPNNSITVGVWQDVGVSYDSSSASNDPAMYIGGVSVAVTETATPSGTPTNNSSAYVWGNRTNDNARCLDGEIAVGYIIDGILTDEQHASLSANPWQLFARREWVPFTASGGGGVTGASSGILALTGTAAGSVLVAGASAGTLALSGSATGTVGATGVTGQSSQTLSLTGTSTATVSVSGQSAQTLALSGTAAGSVRVTGASAGTLSLTGTATATTTGAVTGASNGVLSLSGSATGTVRVSGGSAAVLQITGNAGAQIVVRGVSAGVLSMTGSATAINGEAPTVVVRASLSSRTRIRTDGAGTRPAQRSTASRPRQ